MDGQVLQIPVDQLSSDALQGLIESFIAREGTDYGEVEWSLAEKVVQVRDVLARGEAVIVFDQLSETCSIVARSELRALGDR